MKRTWTKILSVACVAALILSFSACKGGSSNDTTTTAPAVSDASTSAPETTAAVAPTDVSGASTTAPVPGGSTTAPVTVPGGITKPTNTAEAVALYNSAVSKISSTSAKISRTMDFAKLYLAGVPIVDIKAQGGVPEAFNLSNANLSGAKLTTLNSGDVSSFKVTESGDNYVLTFGLKDLKGDSTTTKGKGGYMYFIDYNEAKTLVETIAKQITGGSIKIEVQPKGAVVNALGGSFNVTINKKTGKISKASISFKEHLEAKAQTNLAGISGIAKVDGHGTVNYTLG